MFIRHNEHPIDKVFRQKLHDAEDEVPAYLWEGIRKKSSGRRRFYLFLLMGAAMLCGVVATSIYFLEGKPSAQATVKEMPAENSASENTASGNSSAPTESNTREQSTDSPRENVPNTSDANELIESSPADKNPSPKTSTGKPDSKDKSAGSSASKDQMKPVGKSKPRQMNNSKSAPENDLPVAVQTQTNNSGSVENDKRIRPGKPLPDILPRIAPDAVSESYTGTVVQPANETPELSGPGLSEETRTVLEDEVLAQEGLPYLSPELKSSNAPRNPITWFVGAYGSLAKPLHIQTEGASPEAFDALVARTHSGLVKNLGLNAGLRTSFGLTFSAGLEIGSFDEKHSWVDTTGYNGYYVTYDYQIVYPDPEGIPQIEMVPDTNFSQDYSLIEQSHTNRYTSVNLPLLFGYSLESGRWSAEVCAGPVWKMRRIYEGSFVFPRSDGPPVSASLVLDENPSPPQDLYVNVGEYYTRWKMDLHLGLNIGYAISPRWIAQAGLIYRWMPRPINDVQPLAHRIVQPGASLGVRYHF